jgi:hypothetical protein
MPRIASSLAGAVPRTQSECNAADDATQTDAVEDAGPRQRDGVGNELEQSRLSIVTRGRIFEEGHGLDSDRPCLLSSQVNPRSEGQTARISGTSEQ